MSYNFHKKHTQIATMNTDDVHSEIDLALWLRELHRLSLTRYENYTALYAEYLSTGCEMLGLGVGIVSKIDSNQYVIEAVSDNTLELQRGQEFSVKDTYCAWVIHNQGTVAYEHVGKDSERVKHPVYQAAKLESYISTPIWVEGEIFGTLNFSDTKIKEKPFTLEEIELVELMALGVSRTLERDLVERRRAAAVERMAETTELFESAFAYATIGMALVSPEGQWLRVNKALSRITGYSEDELLALDFQTITHPEDLNADLTYVKEMLNGDRDTYQMEKRYFHREGHIVWVLLSVSLVRYMDGSPRYFISQIHDVSAQKKAVVDLELKQRQLEIANRTLEQHATRDSLTQVYNRRVFEDRLHEERHRSARHGTQLSMLLLDVDFFKQFNDEFGHITGDKALQMVARALTTQGRINNFVARFGGEEFAVILPNADSESCNQAAERIRMDISQMQGLPKPISVSIGAITADPYHVNLVSTENKALLEAADEALYEAKRLGRNRVCHTQIKIKE